MMFLEKQCQWVGWVGWRGWLICLLRIHTKMLGYERIQLVKCDPPLLLASTDCKNPRKAINKKPV